MSIGVPSNANPTWRQKELEQWVRRVLACEADGVDVLLSGQSPLGELLAAPSSPLLEGIAMCVVDVSDEQRASRLQQRNPGVWSTPALHNFNLWGRWHRLHAENPKDESQVITTEAWPAMRWDRWASWTATDPRWRTAILNTTGRTVDECADELVAWIRAERALLADGSSPLGNGWDAQRPISP